MKQHAESLVARLKEPSRWPGFGAIEHLQLLQELAGEAKGRGTTDGYLAVMLIIHQLTEEMIKVLIDDALFYTQPSRVGTPLCPRGYQIVWADETLVYPPYNFLAPLGTSN